MRIDGPAFVRALHADPVDALDRMGAAIPEVAAMAGCPQPPNHHSEGDVWAHTRLALSVLVDLERHVEAFAGGPLRAVDRWPLDLPPRTLTQSLAVLLHDVGKPPTRRGADGAWTYYGHDRVGARIARDLLRRLRLPDVARELGVDLNADRVCWLIDEHLFWLNTRVGSVTDAAVRRRYTDDWARGDDLRVVNWADTLGSRGPDGRPHVELLVAAEVRLRATRMRALAPPGRPPVRGDVVMRALDLEPGPRIGAVLDWLGVRGLEGPDAERALRHRADFLRSAPLADIRRDADR